MELKQRRRGDAERETERKEELARERDTEKERA